MTQHVDLETWTRHHLTALTAALLDADRRDLAVQLAALVELIRRREAS